MTRSYQKLLNDQAAAMDVRSLNVTEEDGGNASTDGKQIYLDPTFMQSVRGTAGEGGVRFVLAHELGHTVQGMRGGHAAEIDADRFAARSLARLGIDFGAVSGVMGLLGGADSKTHPSGSKRAQAVRDDHARDYDHTAALQKKQQQLRKMKRTWPKVKRDRNKTAREHTI